MPRGVKGSKTEKNPFDALDPEIKAKIEGSDDEQIKAIVAEVAMNQAALMERKKADQDLKEKREALKLASEGYTEGTKRNKQVITYARVILSARGKEHGDSGLEGADPVPGMA